MTQNSETDFGPACNTEGDNIDPPITTDRLQLQWIDEKYRERKQWTLVVVLLLSGGCSAANMLVPSLLWRSHHLVIEMLAVGGLVSQIAILGVWCGLGDTALQVRLLQTSSLVATVCASYVLGLQIPELPKPTMPGWVGLFIFIIGAAGFLLVTASLMVVRGITKTRLGHLTTMASQPKANHVSIAYLIGLTTVVAIAAAIIPRLIPEKNEPFPNREMGVFILMCVQHGVFSLLLVLVLTWAILSQRNNLVFVVVLVALAGVLLPLNATLLTLYRGVHIGQQEVLALCAFTCGLLLAMTGFMGIMRFLGYRLTGRHSGS